MIGTNERSMLEAQTARALVNKAGALEALNRKEEASSLYDEVIVRFSSNPEDEMREVVSEALLRKGNSLADLNEYEQAIAAYDQLIELFGSRTAPSLLTRVAMALFNKGVLFGKLNRREEALGAFQEIVSRFRNTEWAFPQFITALFNISGTLIFLQRFPEAVETANEVIKACEQSRVTSLLDSYRADALVNKSIALLRMDRFYDAIHVCDAIVQDYSASPYQEQVGKALINKGIAFVRLDQFENALAVYEEALERVERATEHHPEEMVALIMVHKGFVLEKLDRKQEGVEIYQEVLRRFGGKNDPAVRPHVASASNGIGFYLLCVAKKHKTEGDDAGATRELLKAKEAIESALEIRPNEPTILGNLAYIEFLLGRQAESCQILTKAIRLGGETFRQIELNDTEIYPLPQDEVFRELLKSI